jgi:hypothetical protein
MNGCTYSSLHHLGQMCSFQLAFLLTVFFLKIHYRKQLYDDDHLTGTFFDAGGDVNFALVASGVIARWLWTSSYTWSTLNVYKVNI